MKTQKRTPRKVLSPAEWAALPDEHLQTLRVRDLGLHISGSALEPCIAQLHTELSDHGLLFCPSCYLADEWFCPDKVPIIGIPFCLAHPRLMQLEKKTCSGFP
jgi:hypothetical protein